MEDVHGTGLAIRLCAALQPLRAETAITPRYRKLHMLSHNHETLTLLKWFRSLKHLYNPGDATNVLWVGDVYSRHSTTELIIAI
jgi:hypothetical protein